MVEKQPSACAADRMSPRLRRQSAILDAAESLFIEQGYDRTSLAEIVKISGGSLATLYELFTNKQGLLHAIAARWRDEAKSDPVVQDALAPQSNIDILVDYARRRRETLKSPRALALARMLVSECLRDRDFALQTYRELHLPAIRELSVLFAGWAAAGEAKIDDPDAAAGLFLSLIAGDSMLNTLTGIEDGVLDEAQTLWRLQPFFFYFGIA